MSARSLYRIVAFLVGFGLAVLAFSMYHARAHRHWSQGFKADVTAEVELRLLMRGINPEYAKPISLCVADEIEARISQRDLEAMRAGEKPPRQDVALAALKHCACDVVKDPDAVGSDFCANR